jgi:hypothetical protein
MQIKSKRLLNIIVCIVASLCWFLAAYHSFLDQNIDLSKYTKTTSVIIEKGIGTHHSTGKYGGDANCFYMRISDYPEKLGVYRSSGSYQDLLDKFKIGDTVTAYFNSHYYQVELMNIDLFQVEQNGEVLLSKKEMEKKAIGLNYIFSIFGFIFLIMAYLYYKGNLK